MRQIKPLMYNPLILKYKDWLKTCTLAEFGADHTSGISAINVHQAKKQESLWMAMKVHALVYCVRLF